MGFVWAKYAGLWLNGWDTWPVWSDTHSPLFKVRGQHTIVSSEMRYIDFANMRVVLWKNSPIRSLYPPLDDVILVERIAQISESAPLVFDLLPHAMICINYLLIKMAQSFDSALDIKHIIEKYRKASKLKYAKVFQRSVLPSLPQILLMHQGLSDGNLEVSAWAYRPSQSILKCWSVQR